MEGCSSHKRIEWVDKAKSFCMFLVILGHCHIQESDSYVVQFIYSFHMMLFFFLSGFLCKGGYSKETFKKDFLYILLPYYTYGIISVSFAAIRSHDFSLSGFIHGIWMLIIGTDAAIGPIWFLSALFICKQLFYLFILLKKSHSILYYLVVAISFSFAYLISENQTNLPFFADSALCGLPFFLLGNECFPLLCRINVLKMHYHLLIAFSLLGVSMLLSFMNGFVSIADCVLGQSILLYYLNAIMTILSVVVMSMVIKNYGQFIKIASYGSIVILGLHSFILIFFNFYLPKLLGFELLSYSVFIALIYSVISYLSCCVLIVYIDKYCPKLFGLRGKISSQILKSRQH